MVIVDLGSHSIKAGYAYNFPSDEEPRVSASQPGSRHPIQRGSIASFDALEEMLHDCLYNRLGWITGYEGSAVISEPVLTSRADRERLAQLMFEVRDAMHTHVLRAHAMKQPCTCSPPGLQCQRSLHSRPSSALALRNGEDHRLRR